MKAPDTSTEIKTRRFVKILTHPFVICATIAAGLSLLTYGLAYFSSDDPVQPGTGSAGTATTITSINLSASFDHTLALINNELWAWGKNNHGQIGDGTAGDKYDRLYPVRVPLTPAVTITAVAAGMHSLALQSNGTVWAWGYNQYLQLGLLPTSACGTALDCASPQPVDNWNGGTAPVITKIAAGGSHSLVLDSTGHVWTWGANHNGQLGYATTTTCLEKNGTLSPCSGLAKIVTFPAGAGSIVEIAAGGAFNLARDSNNKIYAWGVNTNGQLGLGDKTKRTTPTEVTTLTSAVITKIRAGGDFGLAMSNTGQVWSWGIGRLGFEPNDPILCPTTCNNLIPNRISDLTNMVDIQAGARQGYAKNAASQLIVIDGNFHDSDVDFPSVNAFFCGLDSIFAVKTTDQQLYAKGGNDTGSLGVPIITGVDDRVTRATAYTYKIRALDSYRTTSAYTSDFFVTSDNNYDVTPPTVPTNPHSILDGFFTVFWWNNSTDTESGVQWYEIYRNGQPTLVNRKYALGTNSFSDATVEPGQSYTYTVRAIDLAGNASSLSVASAAVQVPAPQSEVQLPNVPANLRVTYTGVNRVELAWDEATATSEIWIYELYRNGALINTSAGTNNNDTEIVGSTTYTYTVKAVSNNRNRSAASAPVVITTLAAPELNPPSVPTNIQIRTNLSNQIELQWDASSDQSGVGGYEILRNGQPFNLGGKMLSRVLTPRLVSFIVTPPAAPINLTTATLNQNKVNLAWVPPADVVDVTNYRIYRRVFNSGPKFTVVDSVPVATTTYIDKTVTPAVTYEYLITAVTPGELPDTTVEHDHSNIKKAATKK